MSTQMQAPASKMRDGGTFGAGLDAGILTWVLVLLGFVLVCLAEPLGQALVNKVHYGANSYMWNPEQARGIAQNVRIIGSMVFALGLVERLVLEIRSLRREIEKP